MPEAPSAATVTEPLGRRCPRCGDEAEADQLACLRCGARVDLVYRRPLDWRVPAAIVALVVILLALGLGFLLGS